MAVLCVNIDHVATVREARKINEPDPVAAAVICELAGAKGITVHLREDRRHIQDRDLEVLRQVVKTQLNLEMAANMAMVRKAIETRVDMVTLVPEGREEVTTEGGLDVVSNSDLIHETIAALHEEDIKVSLFIDPETDQIEEANNVGASFIELHTGEYANAPTENDQYVELGRIAEAAEFAQSLGLRVNAGHGLNYHNVVPIASIDGVEELNIGHSIISYSIFKGLDQAVKDMISLIEFSE